MLYEIIPQSLYFTPGVDNFLTPSGLNQIFNSINNSAMASDRYIRPLQFVATANTATYTSAVDSSNAPIFGKFGPEDLTITEVGSDSDLLPGGWSATYLWDFDPDDDLTGQGFSAAGTATSSLVITKNSTNIPTATYIKASLTVTYSASGENDIVLTAVIGIPISYVSDGEAAIAVPVPLINATSTHQPLTAPGGSAVFTAEDISFLPPNVEVGSGGTTRAWSLAHNAVNKTSYINGTTAAKPTITIPEVGKTFTLTLTLTVDSTDYTNTIDLNTYDYGSFFFSSWSAETPVDAARSVQLTADNSTKQGSPLFPTSTGSMVAKWGKDIEELQLQDGNDNGFGLVLCVPYQNNTAARKADVSAIMTVYGLDSTANSEEYSLISVYDNSEDLTGLFFWTQNMAMGAELLYKVQDTSNLTAASTYVVLATNSVYLVKGITPTGSHSVATIGPGAERYYVSLKHYSLSTETGTYVYNGNEDKFQTISQSGTAAPITTTFSDIPKSTYFKAEVVAANGSAYSSGVISNIASIGDIAAATIDNIITTSNQYGAKLDISWNGTEPIGFLATYLELDITATWPADAHLYHTQTSNTGYTTIYSSTPTLRLPAKLGKKVVASARAVMHDGSLSDPVTISPVTVEIPTSLELRDFSKSLGRLGVTVSLDDASIVSGSSTSQHNLHYTTFARDTYLEAVHIWVHKCTIQTDLKIQTNDIASADEKTKTLIVNDTGGDHDFYAISDLSLPVSAGEVLLIAVQGGADSVLDLTVELHYSPGEITQYTGSSA